MGIDIYVQNMNHKMTESVAVPAEFTLSAMVSDAPIGSMIRGIHLNADTMFNSFQLELFLEELLALTPKNDDERVLIAALKGAAYSAVRQCGYLWFAGD